MRKKILEALSAVAFSVWGRFFSTEEMRPHLYGIALGIAGMLLIDLIDYLIKERRFLKLYFDCFKPWAEPEIRLTIAYLYRIEQNGKYLLVRSNRIDNTYQPVGGVYKYYNPEAKNEIDCFGAITDNKIENDEVSECDLRLNLLNRKKLGAFLKWFFSKQKREIDPWREFYEELVAPGILPFQHFGYIHYELMGQHFEPIHRDNFFNIDTFKYADIYVPKFVNNEQIEHVKKLLVAPSKEYLWATKQEIMQGKSKNNHLIAEHTHKIFYNQKLHV